MSNKKIIAFALMALLLTSCSQHEAGNEETTQPELRSPAPLESVTQEAEVQQPENQPAEIESSGEHQNEEGKIDPTKRLAYVTQDKSVGVIEQMPEPADVAELRQRIGDTTEMMFFRVSVDNRRSSEAAEIGIMTGIDSAGRKYTFGPLQNYLLEVMMDPATSQLDDSQGSLQAHIGEMGHKYDRIVDLEGTADVVLVTTDLPLPASFERMEISPHLWTLEDVVPVGMIDDPSLLEFEVAVEHRR